MENKKEKVDETIIPQTEDETLIPTDDIISPDVVTIPPTTDVPVEPVTEPIGEPVIPLTVDEPVLEVPSDQKEGEPIANPCDAIASCDGCGCGCDKCEESPMTIAKYFGTLQECVTITWRFHLKTRKHHVHVTLNEFYDDALNIVDKLIEQYQGCYGVIDEPFTNCICGDEKSEVCYLNELKTFVETNKSLLGEKTELSSTLDEFLGLIDSTIYKLTSFCENEVKSFEEFCYENLNEKNYYDRCGERHSDDPNDPDYDPDYDNAEEEE